jgi:uncharacterized protein YdhG (YjbR/CyaY superfamily)
MPTQFASIEDYVKTFPPEIQVILQKIRKTVHEAAPDAAEAIAYQMPTFRLSGNLVHFAAFKHHIGFYPTPSGTDKFAKEIAPYRHAKGSIQFPLDKPIPYDLIEQIVKFRLAENLKKKRAGDG